VAVAEPQALLALEIMTAATRVQTFWSSAQGGESSERPYRAAIIRGVTGGGDGFSTTPGSVTSNFAAGYTAPARASVPGNLFLK
jgi:hypothetical protein